MKVLVVLTSHDQLGHTGRQTGYWLEELAGPFYVLRDAEVDVALASLTGGRPPLDPKSAQPEFQTELTLRFQADPRAQAQLDATRQLSEILASDFDAVFFPGGHGVMWDLPESITSILLIEAFAAAGKPIAAVCHGPAALVNARDREGQALVRGRNVTGYSNAEEEAVELNKVVPFLLETRLREREAHYHHGPAWKPFVQVDGALVTGQNPASSIATAEALLSLLRRV